MRQGGFGFIGHRKNLYYNSILSTNIQTPTQLTQQGVQTQTSGLRPPASLPPPRRLKHEPRVALQLEPAVLGRVPDEERPQRQRTLW